MKINENLWNKILSDFDKKRFFSENFFINELLKARFLLLQYKSVKKQGS
ncbi:MAG: hypothetical protein DMNBKLKJ_00311 [Candidatus Westeberhardia cardiocondylae]|nr:hypothetical protein [Candidatus Westeberhardia cardiocondylae]